MKKYKRRKSYWKIFLLRKLKKYNIFGSLKITREFYVFIFFCFLFFIIILRLFYLQVIRSKYYEGLLGDQHVSKSLLKAERGNIFVYDESGSPVQLTENIITYNVFVDPSFLTDKSKEKFIDIMTPVIYEHFCVINGMNKVDKNTCIKNIEFFTQKTILPKKPVLFYYGSGASSGVNLANSNSNYDLTGFYQQRQEIIDNFNSGVAYKLIKERMDKKIFIGILPENYVGFFANAKFLEELKNADLPFVDIKNDNYVYIIPSKVRNIEKDSLLFKNYLSKFGYLKDFPNLINKFVSQENRYIKIISDVNPSVAKMVKDFKNKYYYERTENNIPILYGLGLEKNTKRYYPYGEFLSNVLGYVDSNGVAYYGVEKYFNELLGGKDGEIKGRSSAWMGQATSNDFYIIDAKDGSDVYLTIDIGIQKELESLTKKYQNRFKADSVSVLVYDINEGKIKASAMSPTYNPNNYNDAYEYMPLTSEYSYIVNDITYLDIPIFFRTGGEMKLCTTKERFDPNIPKFLTKNIYGSMVFIDRNVSMAYEPGSIFKSITVGIGLDTDEIRFYDNYYDSGFVKVGPYKISNVDKNCIGNHDFLHAWIYSCNVGMVKIAAKIGKESFYNYLKKLGFGELTNIELANEDPGDVWSVDILSKARFFNNTFGQGLTVTPLQLAVAYSTLVNGGKHIKPTIVAGIRNKQTGVYAENKLRVVKQVLKADISNMLQEGLFDVMETNPDYVKRIRVAGFSLGGKSGTSQISYKGRYKEGLGWTNTSFVGFISRDNPKYIVVIQVRRPRNNIWSTRTAGPIFNEVARFLINYLGIEK